MTVVTWYEAKVEDREALKSFECTEKPRKSAATGWHQVHRKPWEHEVQSVIRDLRPPVKLPQTLLLGFDIQGVVAVSRWEELDGPAYVELLEMAIARRCRGTADQSLSAAMFRETLDRITARAIAACVPQLVVQAMVWHENLPSQRMCRNMHFCVVGHGAPGVQIWQGRLPIRT